MINIYHTPKLLKRLGSGAMVPFRKVILVRDLDAYEEFQKFNVSLELKSVAYEHPFDWDNLVLWQHECHHIYQFELLVRKLWILGYLVYYLWWLIGFLIPFPKKKPIERIAYKIEKIYQSPYQQHDKIYNLDFDKKKLLKYSDYN